MGRLSLAWMKAKCFTGIDFSSPEGRRWFVDECELNGEGSSFDHVFRGPKVTMAVRNLGEKEPLDLSGLNWTTLNID